VKLAEDVPDIQSILLHNEGEEIKMVRLSVEALTSSVVRGAVSNFVRVGVKDKS
jgi:hypothetical protein